MTKISHKKGFTLLELVIIIAMAGALMTGIATALNTQMHRFMLMRRYYQALNLAKARIATFNNLTIASLPANGTIDYTDPSFSGFTIRQITTTPYSSGSWFVRQIRVEVFTTKEGDLVNLYTYRTNAAAIGDGKIGNTDAI